ncbi:MAG: FAD-dependent oxidoreductase [Gammaproteobacteria bacterium]
MRGTHESIWLATTPQGEYPALDNNLNVDVAVIGAGFTGLTTAWLLKRAGLNVAVLEAGRVAAGVSGHTTAKITSQHHRIYRYLLDKFGKEDARRYADANQHALSQMKSWIAAENIQCDFTEACAYIFAETAGEVELLKQEVEGAQALGLPAAFTTETELPFPVQGAVRFTDQAQFHPRKYLLALAARVNGGGSFVFEHTRALAINERDRCAVRTAASVVSAKDVMVATHFPITDHGPFSARLTPMRHYAICVAADKALQDMYISSEAPIHSIRTCRTEAESLLMVMGEAHRTGEVENTESHYERLIAYARGHFGADEVRYRWSSQDLESVDKVPYIGRLSPLSRHQYTATGFRAWGITHATVAAIMLSDIIQGREHPWHRLYTPARIKPVASTKEFVKHNVHAVRHLVGDRLKRKEALETLAPGQGKLVKLDNRTVAAYKDDDGNVSTVSATCTHLGCLVSWNNAEKSWDCACHGSRFAPDGGVLHGPAITALKKI